MSNRFADIEVFLKVVERLSLSRAAETLHASPSSVSKALHRLESRLGVRLVNRTSRAFSLTQEGRRLYEHAGAALRSLEDAERNAVASGADAAGVLRIGTTPRLAKFHLAPRLPGYLERYPRVDVHFVLQVQSFPLVENQVDLAFFSGAQPDSTYISRRVGVMRWVTCASPEYLARAGVPNYPKDLTGHECLTFLPGDETPWTFKVEGEVYPFIPSAKVRGNSSDLLRVLALEGIGIARVPFRHVERAIASGALVALLERFEDPAVDPVYALYPSSRNLAPKVTAFLEYLDECGGA